MYNSRMQDNQPTVRFARIFAKPMTGDERLRSGENLVGVRVLDFWRWSMSDLMSNTARGVLAEFIVATALGIPTKDTIREEWAPYDLESPEGIRVEVKSAAFLQSWAQVKESVISFRVPKKRAWCPETNRLELEARRQAEVYVFALLAHRDQETIDLLNVDQWHFYVLPTAVLDARTRSQRSITLKTLDALSGGPVSFAGVREAVKSAAQTAHG